MRRTISDPYSVNAVYLLTIACRFLLVSLNIDAILGEVTIRRRRKKLEEMTLGHGLSDAYMATLTRLKAQKGYKSVLGLKVLMWVMYSARPLRAQELCHALGVEIGSADLDLEDVPALRTLVSSCLGLVTVEASSSTVRLVHFTLQEYLSSDPTLFHNPHSTIAEVCLTYLNFRCIRDLSPTLRSAPTTTHLLEYASFYWGVHTRVGMTENIKMLALRLLDSFDEHISAQLLLLRNNRYGSPGRYYYGKNGPTRFTGLHGAAFLGVVGIVSTALEMMEWEVNAYDCMGMTALTWAAARGHEEVVKMFLGREDVNPDQADAEYGRTPLSWAAQGGHEGIVKMLLEREDVNPDRADTRYGRTPLSWAAENEHEGIVIALLERKDALTPAVDSKSQTPLSLALSKRHGGVVKMILDRENADSDTADGGSQVSLPLPTAHESGRAEEMRFRGDDPNTNIADFNGQPALPSAELNEREMVQGFEDSVSKPADIDFSPTQQPRLPLPPSVGPLNSQCPQGGTRTHPNASKNSLSSAIDRRFVVSSLVCLFALLLYILSPPSLDNIFSSRKYLPGEGSG